MKKAKKVVKIVLKVVKFILPYIFGFVADSLKKNCKGGECNEQSKEWQEYLKRKDVSKN